MFELTLENARGYLVERRVIQAASNVAIEPLGWGISNTVLKVSLPGECFVIKQPLAKLRVKTDWPFDRARIFVEHDSMVLLRNLLPEDSLPEVRFLDDENFVLGMSCASDEAILWKEALLKGQVELSVAERAGTLLATMHNQTAFDSRVKSRFANYSVFIQGRVDPYHWTVAEVHRDLAPLIESEVKRMLQTRLSLVHGDYSPKNIFIYPDHLFVLDFEVAHFGDPAFDTAFCITHLILKAIRFPKRSVHYLSAARTFWRAYSDLISHKFNLNEIEATTIRELGCLLLARIDGKSKVEYITDEPTRDLVRQLGRDVLTGSETVLDGLFMLISQRIIS